MLRIPWTAKESNGEVYTIKIGKKCELLNISKIGKTLYFGHLQRKPEYKLLQTNNNGKGRRKTNNLPESFLLVEKY